MRKKTAALTPPRSSAKATLLTPDYFRTEKIPVQNVKFILPPKSELEFDGNVLKPKHNYHFVYVKDLSKDYLGCLANLNTAEYNADDDKVGNHGSSFNIRLNDFADLADADTKLEVRIHYKKLLEKSAGEIIRGFKDLAKLLLLKLAEKEVGDDPTRPQSICQDILEKIYELIPVPQDAALARYGFSSDGNRVILPLSPKFTLKVETSLKRALGGFNFQHDAVSQQTILIFRRQDADSGKVIIVQRPFLETTYANYPDNFVGDNKKLVLLSTGGDIQMSKSLNTLSYIAFYEGNYRENNRLLPPAGESSIPDGEAADDEGGAENPDQCSSLDDICARNSYLLFSDDPNDFFVDSTTDFPPQEPIKAVFGERNLITPLILISVNEKDVYLPLGTRIIDLVQSRSPTKKYEMERWHKDDFSKYPAAPLDTILLPGDRLKDR